MERSSAGQTEQSGTSAIGAKVRDNFNDSAIIMCLGQPNGPESVDCTLLGFDTSHPDQWDDWGCIMNIGFDCICKT